MGAHDGGGVVLRPGGAGSGGPRVRLSVGERIVRVYGGGVGAASGHAVHTDVRTLALS
jgi:hypothetical protein